MTCTEMPQTWLVDIVKVNWIFANEFFPAVTFWLSYCSRVCFHGVLWRNHTQGPL